MLKEIKYLIFLLFISFFIFFTGKYYFSDDNKKNSFRSLSNIEKKIDIYSEKLPVLENDTKVLLSVLNQQNLAPEKRIFLENINHGE